MKFIVDKITNNIVRLEAENNKMIEVTHELFPRSVKEGDVISIIIDKEESLARENRIQALMEDVWED